MTSTQQVAIQSISKLYEVNDFDPIFEIYKNDPKVELRKEAAWTLQKMVSSKNWNLLFEQWKEDSIDRHRIWACELAEAYGDLSHIQILEELLNDQNGHVRKASQKALNRIKCVS